MAMDSNLIPPPLPQDYEEFRAVAPAPERRRPMSYGRKIFLMAVQAVMLAFALGMIFVMVYDREYKNKEVAESIVSEWGGHVFFNGIEIRGSNDGDLTVFPDTYACDVKVDTKTLHRSIYEAEVFDARLTVSGTVSRSQLQGRGETVSFIVDYDPEAISSLEKLKIGSREYAWTRGDDKLTVSVPLASLPENIEFGTAFTTRGSGGVYVAQIGDRNKIKINGKASNPSFQGRSLPESRTVRDRNFHAEWKNEGIPRQYRNAAPQALDEYDFPSDYGKPYVGADFLVGVDRYQKVARTLKYSFIIILLTYLAVLLVEVISKRRVPLLNYFLTGAALVLFYTLLLSFVELMAFGWAYLIAAVMTVALITAYMRRVLNSNKLGLLMLGILAGLYGSIYVMLNLATLALLLGSLILFVALAACMYASLRFNRQPQTTIPS